MEDTNGCNLWLGNIRWTQNSVSVMTLLMGGLFLCESKVPKISIISVTVHGDRFYFSRYQKACMPHVLDVTFTFPISNK